MTPNYGPAAALQLKELLGNKIHGETFSNVKKTVTEILNNNIHFESIIAKLFHTGVLSINFQGIHNTDGSLYKEECLLRVNGGNPEPFLSWLESNNFTHILAKYQIENAVKLRGEESNEVKNDNFSVNINPAGILEEGFILSLEKTNLDDVKKITLEITENKLPSQEDDSEQGKKKYTEEKDIFCNNIKRLKDKGYKIAIDDFGAKHSNIERIDSLKQIGATPDYIKIDGLLVGKIIRKYYENNNEEVPDKYSDDKYTIEEYQLGGENIDDKNIDYLLDFKKNGFEFEDNEGGTSHVKIIAEYIQDEDDRRIIEEVLGIKLFQGSLYWK